MQYEGWVNPYGANMGDLIARSGDALAHASAMTAQAQSRADEIRAQAYGGAVQNIGQIPGQIIAQRNAQVDTDLKRQALKQGIDDKQTETRQRIVATIGKLANGSKSSDDFVSSVDDMAKLGGLPPDVAAHIKTQVQTAGPEGWDAVKNKYVEFGSTFMQATKLGEKERLLQPLTNKPIVNAVKEMRVLRPGDVGFEDSETPGAPPVQVASAPFAPGTGIEPVNGQLLDKGRGGVPVGAPVPKQEGASEVALNAARVDEVNKKIEEIDNQIAGSMPISAKDRAELAIQRQRLEVERSHYKAVESGQDINSPKNQERLEESYRSLLKTTQSSRSGGMGLEDKKVDQAKHLLALLDQTRGRDGAYSMTPVQQSELSMGLATLISPTGVPSDGARKDINAATASGDLAKLGTYLTGTPFAGTPQKIAELLRESIERQGVQAEQNREGHFGQLRAFAPTDLSAERKAKVEQGLVQANRLSVEVDGFRFPTQTAADAYQKAKAKQ